MVSHYSRQSNKISSNHVHVLSYQNNINPLFKCSESVLTIPADDDDDDDDSLGAFNI